MNIINRITFFTLIALTLYSCGKPEEEVVKETFSLSQLKEAGLVIVSPEAENGASSYIFLYCNDSKPERADVRRKLLTNLYNWVDGTKGDLSLDGKSIGESTIKTLATNAKAEFDGIDDEITECPDGTGSLASGIIE